MANWKKIIVSGSDAHLSSVTASNLTNNYILQAGIGGRIVDSGLTFDGSTLGIGTAVITSTGATSILSGSFSGSFVGDGSGLTGLVSSLAFSGSDSGNDVIDLLTEDLTFDSGTGLTANVTANQISYGIADGGVGATQIAEAALASGGGLLGGGGVALSVDSGSLLPYYSSSIFSTISGDLQINSAGVATVQLDSVALGTDTTGDYVQNLGTLTGLTTTGNSGEGSTPTLSITYGSTANTAVEGNTNITINGTSGEIGVTGTAAQALGAGPTYTITLPDTITGNRTFANNVTVTGDLTVNGTTTTLNTQNLEVEDKFIFLNAGSGSVAPVGEGGMIVESGTANSGSAFYYDGNSTRWSLAAGIAKDATTVVAEAFSAAVVDVANGQTDAAAYQKNGNIKVDSSGDIWIYS